MPLTIVACIKDVPDPEGPRSSFEIHSDLKKVVPVGIPPVLNAYDENGLELALRLKDLWGGRVIALNMSAKAVTSVLKKALAAGADELIIAEDACFAELTSYATALVLCAAIKKIGAFDLIVTGRQAADWYSGQVGLLIAGMLKIPGIGLVQKAELKDQGIIEVEKLKRTGYEVLSADLPALLTVSNEAGNLRLPTLKAIQDAKKKPVTVWRASDLHVDTADLRSRAVYSVTPSRPPSRLRHFIEGKTPAEKVENLLAVLRRDKVI